jgi:oligopeptide/dipeptide ABC transporter ATP-binding protein
MSDVLLSVRNLKIYFNTPKGLVRAVDGASFDVGSGEFLCLICESGSGKSVSALSVVGLVDGAPGIVGGEIRFESRNLLEGLTRYCSVEQTEAVVTVTKNMGGWRKMHRKAVEEVRGRGIGMIFQDPVTSLNPLFTVAWHIGESARLRFGKLTDAEKNDIAAEWLSKVRIAAPRDVASAYPFQLSGGMAQRVMIAIALAGEPKLLIADEPTTALDATVQLDILRLLKSLQEEMNLSILFITHDIGIGANFADSIAVMYAGRVVESGPADSVLRMDANHPYTNGLLHAALKTTTQIDDKQFIKGSPPDAFDHPAGCTFHPRCEEKNDLADGGKRCEIEEPHDIAIGKKHNVRCWKYE